jgi:isoquinoline 1-oxidoreductase beta subunit
VAVDGQGNVTVPRVDTAIDCGFYINPERIQSQIEGAAVMGLSLAKLTQITFKDGRVQQNNFHDYKVLRIGEGAMDVRTYIVPNGIDIPSSGVGEPGVPPFAPAFINAVFAATGKRIRDLPLGEQLSA